MAVSRRLLFVAAFSIGGLLQIASAFAMPPLLAEGGGGFLAPRSLWSKPAGVDRPAPPQARPLVSGNWKTLVILIDFPDYHWDNGHDPYFANGDSTRTYVQSHYSSMLFSDISYKDPFATNAYTGSLRDFYRDNSYGQFLVSGTVTVWYRAPHTYRYYCNTDGVAGTTDDYGWARSDSGMVWDLVRDAVTAANPTVDFSQFDNNHDGKVDGLFVVHAGPGAEAVASNNSSAAVGYIWSHKWSIPNMVVDGVTVSGYTMEPEDGTVGVFCHEFGHDLGLPDLYDVDYSSEGMGEWDLMSSGGWCRRPGDPYGTCPAHMSAWCKTQLGWVVPTNVTSPRIAQSIPPVETSPAVYRLWTNGASGGEYFLIENRQNIGFDVGLTRRQYDYGLLPANGLLIYHVDESMPDNTNEAHKRIDVVEATPYWTGTSWFEQLDRARSRPSDQYLSNPNRGDNGDPWPGWSGVNATLTDYVGPRSRDAFGPTTSPSSNAYSGAPSGVALTHIALSGANVVADLYTSTPTAIAAGARVDARRAVALAGPSVLRDHASVTLTVAAAEAPAAVRVIDARGRTVRELYRGRAEAGDHVLTWDARDANGHVVPSGVYILRAEVSDAHGVARVAEMRTLVVR
jgi:M6 family metalloprotease-like protein